MDSSAAMSAELLVTKMEELARNRDGLPSTQLLFKMGGLLQKISAHEANSAHLFQLYRELIDSLPESFLQRVFSTFEKATQQLLLQQGSTSNQQSQIEAAFALNGLLSHSPRLCKTIYSNMCVSLLASLLDNFVLQESPASARDASSSAISSLLLDGLIGAAHQDNRGTKYSESDESQTSLEEQLLNALRSIEERAPEGLRLVQSWQETSEPHHRSLTKAIRDLHASDNHDGDDYLQQREYILSMLESSQQPDGMHKKQASQRGQGTSQTTIPRKPVSATDELERRIQHVRSILPDFGEGFIETALSLHQGDVETTISSLLNDPKDFPTALRILDPKLPRRRKIREEEELQESKAARDLVKERVAMVQEQEEAKYKALLCVERQQQQEERQTMLHNKHDEYDDDYDDQYDEFDVKLGGVDSGMYDFEQVKLYNQVVRLEESDDKFWEENRNMNRGSPKKNQPALTGTEEEGTKQYRGPDKIKGGRIIGSDGKVVKRQGRSNITNKKNSNKNDTAAVGGNQKQGKGGAGGAGSGSGSGSQPQKGKPRTKPKSSNRVNRQRDKKAKAQGAFGVQS